MSKYSSVITLPALLLSLIVIEGAIAQPAPIPRAVVPSAASPESMSPMFAELESGDRTIQVEGAQWLQLQFSEFQLGDGGELTIRSVDDSQTFTQDQLENWKGLTAVFNGSEITITLTAGPSGEISAEVGDVIVGLPGPSPEVGTETAGQPLIDLLGADLQRFIPSDEPRQPDGPILEDAEVTEAICGAVDNRAASNHPASGRIMPIGCTGWIIQGGALLTAGHCIDSRTRTVEFNVPASAANGATVSPPVRDQYRVISSSIVDAYTGVGNDWAVFEVLPNTQTGLTPIAAQGSAFTVSNTANPSTVQITGFGVDGPSPGFGNPPPLPPPRNSDNQTQQTHNGALTQNTGGASTGILRYSVDTQGGNSGSPVIVDGTDQTIGIHTNGGCTSSGGTNAGTSFRNATLWTAIRPATSEVGSIWQYTGTPCSGNSCPGWQKLDNNAATVRIATGGGNLYQLHNTGKIWRSTGAPCSGTSCPGWQMLDNNSATVGIAAGGTQLYQLHNTGKIWRSTGTPCSGTSCHGWQMLDNNPATIAIVADGGQLYQLHNTGKIWRYTGAPCSGTSCSGWQMLDNNGATVSIAAGGGNLYQLHNTGKIWRYTGAPCSGTSCPGWQMLDNNPATIAIVAGSQLYQLHNTGKIWKSTGVACSGNSCPGWQMLDNNQATIGIYSEGSQLYQLHNTGKIWKSTGVACSGNSCPGWQMLDNNANTGRVAAAGSKLYQLHLVRTPMTRTRTCYECK